jgi:hypothetical protein
MNDTKALAAAFTSLTRQPTPPRALAALSYSERRFFDRAIQIYSSLPESASEIRQAFHCTKASAVKIHAALAGYFAPAKPKRGAKNG